MDEIKTKMQANTLGARLARTIIEGVLSVLVVNIVIIVGWFNLSPEMAAIVTALLMAILSPVIAMLHTGNPEDGLNNTDQN